MAYGNVAIMQRIAGVYVGFGYEVQTVSTTALALTASEYVSGDRKAQVAHITVETNPINYTYEGTTPTAAVGHNLIAGSTLTLAGYANIVAFRMIRSGGADATVKITYEG
jgi:hypothetical protein